MPPKGYRSARGSSTRGAGRGRGQGTSAAAPPSLPVEDSQATANTAAIAPTQAASTEAVTTDTQVAPNMTSPPVPLGASPPQLPAEAATPTPAITSQPSQMPAPPQRLDSLRSTSATAPARAKKVPLKFQPKAAARRPATEREQLEAAKLAEEEAERAAEAAKQSHIGRGGRGKDGARARGRGRGGYMGEGRSLMPLGASGPFGAGSLKTEGGRSFGGGSGGLGGAGNTGGYGGGSSGPSQHRPIKTEPGARDPDGDTKMGGSRTGTGQEDPQYVSSDEDMGDEGPRRNVERFVDLTLDNDDDDAEDEGIVRSKTTDRALERPYEPGMAPVRVRRQEHRERNALMDMDPSKATVPDDAAQAQEGAVPNAPKASGSVRSKLRDKSLEVVRTERRWKGAWTTSSDSENESDVRIKPEPRDDNEEQNEAMLTEMQIDGGDAVAHTERDKGKKKATDQDPPTSPESKRKGKSRTRRVSGLASDIKAEGQTAEEREEFIIRETARRTLRDELAPPPQSTGPAPRNATQAADAEGDAFMTEALTQPIEQDQRADRVYLFQFPPVIPNLYPITESNVKNDESEPVDAEAGASNTEGEAMNLDAVPPAGAGASMSPTDEAVEVSDNDDGEDKIDAYLSKLAGSSKRKKAKRERAQLAPGLAGKLRIHASGRATLDWGGTSLEVNMGISRSFLEDVVTTKVYPSTGVEKGKGKGKERAKEGDGEGASGEREVGGEAMSFGQVRGKFVVTPDWKVFLGNQD
ncbi:hypothetical protein LTR66_002375 [Elasticomyces elasticus]|nr:hypothetical protein LTR66_002375 [Elasticomyces elasticus]